MWRLAHKEVRMQLPIRSRIVMSLVVALALSRLAGLAQGTTTYSGRASALRANAVGISTALADTGALPSTGGSISRSLAGINVLGFLSATALESSTSGSGSTSQSQSTLSNITLLGSLVAATAVRSQTSATCDGSTATTSGSGDLVDLVVAGQSIVVSDPNIAISLPGGISVILNEQTSSSGGNTAAITVNALHIIAPDLDIVLGSSHSDIVCP
jgi:hypothetical protein